jgi:hypothetical protein
MSELVDIPLVGALDESSDGKVTQAPGLVTLRNLERAAGSEKALTKRRGTSQIGLNHTPGLTGPTRLIPHGDQLLALDSTSVYTYQDSTDNFHRLANSPKATLEEKRPLAAYAAEDVIATGCAATDDFIVYAWTTKQTSSGGSVYHVHAQVVDRATGAPSNIGTQIPSSGPSDNDHGPGAALLRVFKTGTAVMIVYGSRTTSFFRRISYIRVTDANGPSLGSWSSDTQHTNTADQTGGTGWFDACALSGTDNYWVVAWVTLNSATAVEVQRYNGATQVGGVTSITTQSIGTRRVGVVGMSASSYALYVVEKHASVAASSGLKRWLLTDTHSVTQAATAAPSLHYDCTDISCGKKSSTQAAVILVDRQGAQLPNCDIKVDTVASATLWADSMATPIYDTQPESKPFTYGTDTDLIYFISRYWTSAGNNYNALCHVDMSETEPVAILDVLFNHGTAANATGQAAASFAELGGGEYLFAVRSAGRVSDPSLVGDPTVSTQVVDQINADAFRMKFDAPERFVAASLGGYLFTGGGYVSQFDGARFVELGFVSYPDMDSADYVVATTTGSMVAGTYLYCVVYEWWDGLGNRHQSAGKIVSVTVTGTTASKVTISIQCPRQTRKRIKLGSSSYDDGRAVTAAIYRSVVDGDTLYRLEGASGQVGFPEMVEYLTFFNYVDTYSDAQLALSSRELLYTSSAGANELQNFPFPACAFIVAHQDRLWGIKSEDPRGHGVQQVCCPR